MRDQLSRDRGGLQNRHAKTLPLGKNTKRLPVLPLIGLMLAVTGVALFAHWPVLDAQAINLDDQKCLFDNPVLQNPSWKSAGKVLGEVFKSSTVQGYYEPLTLISLMLDVAAGGNQDHLKPFHVTSLVLHLLNTALVIVFLYMLFGRPWAAAGVGLLFGVHPLTVEPVAWVWERKTLLAGFFTLWCLVLYVRHARRPGVAGYLGVVGMFVLALLAKPTVTPLPVLLLLLDFWPLGRLSKRAVLEKVPLLAIAGISAVITVISTAGNSSISVLSEHSPVQLLLKTCYLIVFYLCKMVWPVNLSSIYVLPQPMSLSQPVILGAVAGCCGLALLLAVSLRWTRGPVMASLFFLAAISPTLGVVQYSWVAASDKYVYIPGIGLLIVLTCLLAWLAGNPAAGRASWRRPACCAVSILAAASLFIHGTRQYLREWRTTEQYASYMVGLAPDSAHVYNRRGNAYGRAGAYEPAIQDFDKAIELKPDFAEAHCNRAAAHDKKGRRDLAIQDYSEAIRLDPEYAEAYCNRGHVYEATGNRDLAIRDYNKALELKPEYAEAYYGRGVVCEENGDRDQAIRDYTRAIEIKPDYAEAYNNLGVACGEKQDYDRALRVLSKAIELKAGYAEAYLNRGGTYGRMGSHARAIQEYTTAIAIEPDNAPAYNGRSVSYYLTKEYDKAWADVKKCRQLGGKPHPDFIKALSEVTGRTE